MVWDFTDRRVLVTGSTRGIGLATARAFLAAGAKVAINGRKEEAVAATIQELGGERMVAAAGSVSTAHGCRAIVEAAVDGLGGLDVLVNNAGILEIGPFEEITEDSWDRLFDTNVKGTFLCSQAALPALREGGGAIVNLSSVAGLEGYAGFNLYCATKGAVTNLTRAMARELAPEVRVNCVCPTGTDTEMVQVFLGGPEPARNRTDYEASMPMRRMATVEEVADSILFLTSDQGTYLSGVALPIDGARTAGR